jgi:hypothetical protein
MNDALVPLTQSPAGERRHPIDRLPEHTTTTCAEE